MSQEIWKPIPNYEGYYEASNLGRVKRVNSFTTSRHGTPKKVNERIMKCGGRHYLMVMLSVNNSREMKTVHRLIASAFIPNPENKPCVNHVNGNKHDNKIDNLEWCTYSENERHSHKKLNKKVNMSTLVKQGVDIKDEFVIENGKTKYKIYYL